MAASKTTESISWQKADKVSKELLLSSKKREKDLGLALAIAIRTGLRKSDLLSLRIENIKEGKVTGKASKTGKDFGHPIPDWLIDEIHKNQYLGNVYSTTYSHMWLNRSVQRVFPAEYARALKNGKTIGAHSLRKAFGLRLYEAYGVNAARQGLQHSDSATTARYLEIPAIEQEKKQAELFG
tara:strand:- start:92715 stop:93260 length:546 start_codon:yes stop_codon:yes gene_type:complete